MFLFKNKIIVNIYLDMLVIINLELLDLFIHNQMSILIYQMF